MKKILLILAVFLLVSSCGTLTWTGDWCADGMIDRDETDVDCGGQYCSPCSDGMVCEDNEDCESGVCDGTTDTCAESTDSACYHDWSCGSWSECQPDETQTRTCTYTGTCSTTGDPEETEQSCTYSSSAESFTLCNDDLYLGTSIADCQSVLTDLDLDLLADDVYHDAEGTNDNDEKYSQTISFGSSSGIFGFTQDDADAPTADNYLFIDNPTPYSYGYFLIFDNPIIYDSTSDTTAAEDFVGTSLNIMGTSYTITDASVNSSGNLDSLRLTISAKELTLKEGYGLQVNGLTVEGSLVHLVSSVGELTGVIVYYGPSPDELYLPEGDSLEDPLFSAFNLNFESIENDDYESIEFVAGSSAAEIRFKNQDGRLVEIPLAADAASVSGEASNEPIYWGNEAPTSTTANQDELVYFEGETCTGSTSVVDCQGAMFLVVDAYGQAHLMQITNIDTASNLIDLDDLTYGVSYNDNSYLDSVFSLSLNGVKTIQLLISESAKTINFVDLGCSSGIIITTENKATLEIINMDPTSQKFEYVLFGEYDDDETEKGYLSNFEITAVYDDATDNSIEFNGPLSLTSAEGYGLYDESDTVDDFQYFETWKGTKIGYDREDMQSVVIEHPYRTIYAVVTLNSII